MSRRHHARDWPVLLSLPGMPRALRDWAAAEPGVTCVPRPEGALGWDVKPRLLSLALNRGASRAVWLDSDVILAAPPGPALAVAADTLVASLERPWGGTRDGGARARAWGYRPARPLPATINSAVLSVTSAHGPLLDDWIGALRDPRYRAAQDIHWTRRPVAFYGDQDALTALLTGPHAGVPLAPLRRGAEIVHAIGPRGFTLAERLGALGRGLPPFIHGQGPLPWAADRARHPAETRRSLDLSPYSILADRLAAEAGIGRVGALSRTGRLMRGLAGERPVLAGLPLAAFLDLRTGWRHLGRRVGRKRRPDSA